MKKFFISIMALILGTTGYAVVDKTIEERVKTLEIQVDELQEEVSNLLTEPETFPFPTTMASSEEVTNEDVIDKGDEIMTEPVTEYQPSTHRN